GVLPAEPRPGGGGERSRRAPARRADERDGAAGDGDLPPRLAGALPGGRGGDRQRHLGTCPSRTTSQVPAVRASSGGPKGGAAQHRTPCSTRWVQQRRG